MNEELEKKAIMMGAILSVAQEVDKAQSKTDMAAATIYMTLKLVEKQNS